MVRCQLGGEMIVRWDEDGVGTRGDKGKVNCNSLSRTPGTLWYATCNTEWVTCAVYSPDGNYIVSGSEDKTIRIWNAATGQCVAGPFQGHTDYITSVAYSPDGCCYDRGPSDPIFPFFICRLYHA